VGAGAGGQAQGHAFHAALGGGHLDLFGGFRSHCNHMQTFIG
jgi:hypothetical protein